MQGDDPDPEMGIETPPGSPTPNDEEDAVTPVSVEEVTFSSPE